MYYSYIFTSLTYFVRQSSKNIQPYWTHYLCNNTHTHAHALYLLPQDSSSTAIWFIKWCKSLWEAQQHPVATETSFTGSRSGHNGRLTPLGLLVIMGDWHHWFSGQNRRLTPLGLLVIMGINLHSRLYLCTCILVISRSPSTVPILSTHKPCKTRKCSRCVLNPAVHRVCIGGDLCGLEER